jgi:hypothetical protein
MGVTGSLPFYDPGTNGWNPYPDAGVNDGGSLSLSAGVTHEPMVIVCAVSPFASDEGLTERDDL